MEKYYLAKLAALEQSPTNLERHTKLVEIQYARRPPSFGLVYLSSAPALQVSHEQGKVPSTRQARSSICLAVLEFGADNKAKLNTLRQVPIGSNQRARNEPQITHLDANKLILIREEQQQQAGAEQTLDCVAAGSGGTLFAVRLISGQVRQLGQKSRDRLWNLADGALVECRIEFGLVEGKKERENCCHIHLLAQRSHQVYRLKLAHLWRDQSEFSDQLELLAKYSLGSEVIASKRFVGLQIARESNQLQSVVVLELNDRSLRVVQKSRCLSSFTLANDETIFEHCILTGNNSSPGNLAELLLLSLSRSKLIAHSLQIGQDSTRERAVKQVSASSSLSSSSSSSSSSSLSSSLSSLGKPTNQERSNDPDRLLISEPSFELDQCWSIDLDSIESVRNLISEIDHQDENEPAVIAGKSNLRPPVSLCPMWSAGQNSGPAGRNCPPKYLLIAYRFHLLVYTFEQRNPIPFSVVYDRSFLKVVPLIEGDGKLKKEQQQEQEFVDLKLSPKLVHNFKLIGAQPSDCLFNTLFLSDQFKLLQMRHFSHLGLLIGLSNCSDLLAFKFTSTLVAGQKDNLYQQQVADSVRDSSLLNDLIERFKGANSQLRYDIASLESRQSERPQMINANDQIGNLIQTQLIASETIGSLYNLSMSVSNLIGVCQILVISTINSHFLNPSTNSSSASVRSAHIDNSPTGKLLLTAIKLSSDDESSSIHSQSFRSIAEDGYEPIQAYAVLQIACEIEHSLAISRSSSVINLPVFIMDAQLGEIKVFYTLDKSAIEHNLRLQLNAVAGGHQLEEEKEELELILAAKFHYKSVQVKPIMSYQSVAIDQQELPMELVFWGAFEPIKLLEWLAECFQVDWPAAGKGMSRSGPINQFRSSFTHGCLRCSVRDETRVVIAGDDLIALELIKRHLLKRATSESIELKVDQAKSSSLADLRHLIALQSANFNLLLELISSSAIRNTGSSNNTFIESDSNSKSNRIEMLLENLTNEMSAMDELNEDTDDNYIMENELRTDIGLIVERKREGETTNEINIRSNSPEELDEWIKDERQEQLEIFRDLIFGFIIDALVDFDELQGLNRREAASVETMMIGMRSRLAKLLNESVELNCEPISNRIAFVDRILADWDRAKVK